MNDDGKARSLHAGGAPATEEVGPSSGMEVPAGAANGSETPLNEFARTRLGTHLRAMYDQVLQQPVPDQFRDLIARLEAGEARESAGPETDSAPGAGEARRGA